MRIRTVLAVVALGLTAATVDTLPAQAADPVIGSAYAFVDPGSDCGTPDARPGAVVIHGGTTGVEWSLDGTPVGEVSDPVQRFPFPYGFQGDATATALPGYEFDAGERTTFYLTVMPCPVVEAEPVAPSEADQIAALKAHAARLEATVDRLRDRLAAKIARIHRLRARL